MDKSQEASAPPPNPGYPEAPPPYPGNPGKNLRNIKI